MPRLVIRRFLAALAVLVLAGAGTAPGASAADRSLQIVGGTDASPGAWPFFAVLLVEHPSQPGTYVDYCGGSLIAPEWVLTAAHCVSPALGGVTPDAVLIGRQTRSAGDGDWNGVDRVVVHPAFDPTTATNDAALLHLTHPSPQPPVHLARASEAGWWPPGTPVTVVGFGDETADPNTAAFPETLQVLEQVLLADGDCSAAYGDAFVASAMRCAGPPPSGPCNGDSGGPLVAEAGGARIQVGIVSFGSRTCGSLPSIYTRVEAIGGWARRTAGLAVDVRRLAGADRYATAAALATDRFGGARRVYVATGENFPDALGLGPVAAADGSPVLLVARAGVSAATASALDAIRPAEIVVVGGPAAVPDQVLADLRRWAPVTALARDAGDRFATAAALATAGGRRGGTVFLASGVGFPDALAGGAAAARLGGVVLLTAADRLPAATDAALRAIAPARVVVLGGPAAVWPDVEATVRGIVPDTVRVAGADRYATAAAISAAFVPPTDAGEAVVATGINFPDALAAVPFAAAAGDPVLLTATDVLPPPVPDELARRHARLAVVVGGPGAVSPAVVAALAGE